MDEAELIRFLRALRQYRGTLEGPGQFLLDALVSTGLGRTPDQPHPNETRGLWEAYAGRAYSGNAGQDVLHWETPPWGLGHQAHYRL